MKDCKVKSTGNTVTILNNDENPVITSIECTLMQGIWQDTYNLNATFSVVTKDTEELFSKIQGIVFTPTSKTFGLVREANTTNIDDFFHAVQRLDSLPGRAYSQLHQQTGLDLTKVLYHAEMMEKVAQSAHESALDIAKRSVLNYGDAGLLIELADHYKKCNHNELAIRALSAIPNNNTMFRAANAEILRLLNLQKPLDKIQEIGLLISKFTAALNSQNTALTSEYFSQYCGDASLSARLPDIQTDKTFVLLAMATEYRKMRAELEQLRAFKAQVEAKAENHPSSPRLF